MLVKTLRWAFCFLIVLIQLGAFLEHNWGTAITGLALALFLTVEPKVVKEKTKLSYWIVLTSLIVLFLLGSIWDIRLAA